MLSQTIQVFGLASFCSFSRLQNHQPKWDLLNTHLMVIRSNIAAARDCGSLVTPTNGSSTGHKSTYPNKITFSCDDGFNMAGSRVRYCQSTGIWSGNQTFCIGNFRFLHRPHIYDIYICNFPPAFFFIIIFRTMGA